MTPAPPSKIAVVGAGLLGGSLLAALRKKCPGLHLRAWARREETVNDISRLNLADAASTDLEFATEGAELVIICTPVETLTGLAGKLAAAKLAPQCVVTDVGSVKGSVVPAIEDVLTARKISFVGSHPMAGSEKSGIGNAREDLFEGTTCILTPTLFTTETALQRVRWLWTIAGCRLLEMSPEEHDRKVACISHMPHLAAAAIALSALRDDRDAARCAGNGFRDTTRIASGDPQLWTGIISQNRTQTLAAMSGLQDGLTRLIQVIEQGDDNALLDLLKEAKAVRDQALNS